MSAHVFVDRTKWGEKKEFVLIKLLVFLLYILWLTGFITALCLYEYVMDEVGDGHVDLHVET